MIFYNFDSQRGTRQYSFFKYQRAPLSCKKEVASNCKFDVFFLCRTLSSQKEYEPGYHGDTIFKKPATF
ncbi:hypothetical protein AVEN_105136-1 [Araneus ventricosus]|uniref:Uncharacterized protein n=1 Tax=Araneus ventricosus TaxID=182803 RepID=A0A4Y2V999_ARAVE|nr:hypothetical protein AVEN_105136-1 [Araneus ventricosus]